MIINWNVCSDSAMDHSMQRQRHVNGMKMYLRIKFLISTCGLPFDSYGLRTGAVDYMRPPDRLGNRFTGGN